MGGLATEIDEGSTDIVIEGAHFSDTGTAKMSRRHRLHSEASYRFERGTDRELPLRATARAVALLADLGGAAVVPGVTHAQVPVTPLTIQLAADYPDRVAGVVYGMDTVVTRLQEVGCEVRSTPSSHAPTIAPWSADQRRGPTGRPTPGPKSTSMTASTASTTASTWSCSSPRRRGAPTSPTPPTWPRRSSASRATATSRSGSRAPPRATASPSGSGRCGRSPARSAPAASSRCTVTRSRRRRRRTASCSRRRTRAVPRSRSRTR